MEETPRFHIDIEHLEGYAFQVRFDWDVPDIVMDEPEPLGRRQGPNAARLLGAAVGNCLSASLLFCLHKAKAQIEGLRTRVEGRLARNERGRWRVQGLSVTIHLAGNGETPKRLGRCLHLFEDFCVVTESVRQGIPVEVKVFDSGGNLLHDHS